MLRVIDALATLVAVLIGPVLPAHCLGSGRIDLDLAQGKLSLAPA